MPAASPRSSGPCARAIACSRRRNADPHWLDAIEHETAEVAVAVAAARAETVNRLSGALKAARDHAAAFPVAEIALEGWMEQLLGTAQRARRSRTVTARS